MILCGTEGVSGLLSHTAGSGTIVSPVRTKRLIELAANPISFTVLVAATRTHTANGDTLGCGSRSVLCLQMSA